MGMYVSYNDAIRIILPRDLHIGDEAFEAIPVGANVNVEIQKSRFQVNDAYILSVGLFRGLATAVVAEAAPVEDAPVEDAPVEDAPAEDAPAEDAPANAASANAASANAASANAASVNAAPANAAASPASEVSDAEGDLEVINNAESNAS
jgi:hypothetical protein